DRGPRLFSARIVRSIPSPAVARRSGSRSPEWDLERWRKNFFPQQLGDVLPAIAETFFGEVFLRHERRARLTLDRFWVRCRAGRPPVFSRGNRRDVCVDDRLEPKIHTRHESRLVVRGTSRSRENYL